MAVDAAGNTFVNAVRLDPDEVHHIALVNSIRRATTIGTWSTAGETVAVAPDDSAIYLAGETWSGPARLHPAHAVTDRGRRAHTEPSR